MEKFCVTLAQTTLSLKAHHPFTKAACKGYEAPASALPAFCAVASPEEIAQALAEGAPDEGYGEFICLHRQIAEHIPKFGAVVVHGAAITYADSAVLFMAPSGTGKTTHIRLWKQVFGQKVSIINGDKPMLRTYPTATVYGTPWAGKEGWQQNRSAPLKAICLLRQAHSNRIEKQDPVNCLPQLLQQVYLPRDPEAMAKTLTIFQELLNQVPVYLLECNMEPDAATVACQGMMEAIG